MAGKKSGHLCICMQKCVSNLLMLTPIVTIDSDLFFSSHIGFLSCTGIPQQICGGLQKRGAGRWSVCSPKRPSKCQDNGTTKSKPLRRPALTTPPVFILATSETSRNVLSELIFGDWPEGTDQPPNPECHRKPQMFADLFLEVQDFGWCRKWQMFPENARISQIGARLLRSVPSSTALLFYPPSLLIFVLNLGQRRSPL